MKAATACQDADTGGQALHVLAMERYWAGQPLEGIAYSQQAIAMLEQSPERARLGMAQFVLGLNCLLLGDRERALEAAAQAVLNWRLTRSALPWPWGALATPTWCKR